MLLLSLLVEILRIVFVTVMVAMEAALLMAPSSDQRHQGIR
jgi:hypothetical protein